MSKTNNAIAILIEGLDPFTDDAGNVYICRPRDREGDEEPETIEVPLHSPQTRKYIKSVFGPYSSRGFLSETETRSISDMIEGAALSKPTRSIKSCNQEVIEQKPLASAVKKLAEQGPTVDSAGTLLPKLNRISRLCLASIRFPGRRQLFFPDASAGCNSLADGVGRPFLACSTR